MQYEVTLPADYDMKIIRHRVATKGPLLDNLPGLGIKAYVIRERGVDGASANEYSPFYLWTGVAGMNNFLWGGGFASFCGAFGRPTVQHWSGLAFATGPALSTPPAGATRRTELIAPDTDPAESIERALEGLREHSTNPAVHSTALAIDTRAWELVHFTLWHRIAPEATGQRYEVLHLSTPHLAELPVGRHW